MASKFRIFASLLVLLIPRQDLWWQVELRLEVSGRYEYRENPDSSEGISGHYTIILSAVGSLERDNGDYILYPGESRVVRVRWVESMGGESGRQVMDRSEQIKPELKFYYVLRRGSKIHLDFEVVSPWLAMERAAAYPDLLLPRSWENRLVHPGERYNKDIKEGSNRVCVPERPIYKREAVDDRFHWRWRRENLSASHDHRVDCRLKISRFKKAKIPRHLPLPYSFHVWILPQRLHLYTHRAYPVNCR
jgi:hypothetical protein